MIITDESAPRWLQEFSRFVRVKPLLFLHGNIHDLISYPIQQKESETTGWASSTLPVFISRFLGELGYEIVGDCDPVRELTFETPEMKELFKKIEDAAPKSSTSGMSRASTISPWISSLDGIAAALAGNEVPSAFIIQHASRLLTSPNVLDEAQRILFTRILKASLGSRDVGPNRKWKNLLIFICDKLNDVPPFLYLNNPRARSIRIDSPSRSERMRFFENRWMAFHQDAGGSVQTTVPEGMTADFADLTEGLSNFDLDSLVGLSRAEQIPLIEPETRVPKIRQIIERFKYGVTESQWDNLGDRLREAPAKIRQAIQGQDDAVERMIEMISRARLGLAAGESQRSNRPRGVLFFAGPTGVGKTEMAKALAEALLNDSTRLVRFDMSEFGSEHSDQRLLGAPPGYVGYEEGGELTDAVKRNPFSILLFDEIDKAHPRILDKFLQILDDGRLTDGKGETVYFSECLIIFTSNLGIVAPDGKLMLDPERTKYPELRETVLTRIREHFNTKLGRPEILNRLGDNFVVFDFIRSPVEERILDSLLKKFQQAAREKRRLEISITSEAREELLLHARTQLHHGGRGIRNSVETALINPLSRALFDANVQSPARVQVTRIINRGENRACRFAVEIETKDGLI